MLACAALCALPSFATAQGVVKAQYGDWQMSCDTPPGASFQQCAIIQNVTAEDQPNVGLSVIVLKTADQQARLLRVLAPLGVLLPNGLGLNIDGTDMGRVAFVRCLPNGCVAEVVMDDALLKQLSTGKTASSWCSRRPRKASAFRCRSRALPTASSSCRKRSSPTQKSRTSRSGSCQETGHPGRRPIRASGRGAPGNSKLRGSGDRRSGPNGGPPAAWWAAAWPSPHRTGRCG